MDDGYRLADADELIFVLERREKTAQIFENRSVAMQQRSSPEICACARSPAMKRAVAYLGCALTEGMRSDRGVAIAFDTRRNSMMEILPLPLSSRPI